MRLPLVVHVALWLLALTLAAPFVVVAGAFALAFFLT